jgi:SAM-dependent methyltransferase
MRIDVLALQRFYGSRLGDMARRMVARRVESLWPHADALDVLGLGYPLPYLEPYRAGARRVTALMPATQGAERWPEDGRTLAAVGDETRLPFMDAVFDRVLVVHALEEAEAPLALLRELWRVMAPEGRLLIVAASRSGLWTHADATPFGHGRPYSRSQLAGLLSDSLFEPMASAKALYAPPLDWPLVTGLGEGLERAGELVTPGFGGLVLMEAVKRLYVDLGQAKSKVLLARAAKRANPTSQVDASPGSDLPRSGN